MPAQKLTPELQRFVVERLACFESVHNVHFELFRNHGIDISDSALLHYDPTTCQGKDLRKELKDYFNARREQYMREAMSSPIAHPGYRLARLQFLAEKAIALNNFRGAIAAIAEATRQVGGYDSQALQINMTQNAFVAPPPDIPPEPSPAATPIAATELRELPDEKVEGEGPTNRSAPKPEPLTRVADYLSLPDTISALKHGQAEWSRPEKRAERDRLTTKDIVALLPPRTAEPELTASAFLRWLKSEEQQGQERNGFP